MFVADINTFTAEKLQKVTEKLLLVKNRGKLSHLKNESKIKLRIIAIHLNGIQACIIQTNCSKSHPSELSLRK